MLDKKRILESEKNMRNYLEEGLIKRKTFDKNIFRIFMRNSRESLYVANLLYEKNISSFI